MIGRDLRLLTTVGFEVDVPIEKIKQDLKLLSCFACFIVIFFSYFLFRCLLVSLFRV